MDQTERLLLLIDCNPCRVILRGSVADAVEQLAALPDNGTMKKFCRNVDITSWLTQLLLVKSGKHLCVPNTKAKSLGG